MYRRCASALRTFLRWRDIFLLSAVARVEYTARSISDSALVALCEHRWPGNVRELQNAIERAMMICREEEIQILHLPPAVLQGKPSGVEPMQSAAMSNNSRNLVEAVEAFERSHDFRRPGKIRLE